MTSPSRTLSRLHCSTPVATAGTGSSNERGLKSLLPLMLCFALGLSVAGCRLGKAGSASFASVDISGHSPQQIQEASGTVFREDGYSAYLGGNGQMIFQKEGTRANNISQNGIIGSYYGEQTMFRVVAEIVEIGNDKFRLQCQAYLVRNPGDSFMEDSHPLANARRMPYQHLLNKVAKAVKSMPPHPQ